MANAVPVHAPEKKPVAKKPLSKDAQKIKQELASVEVKPVDTGPRVTKLADGTIRSDS